MILRPSIVFGDGDGFFNRFAAHGADAAGPAARRRRTRASSRSTSTTSPPRPPPARSGTRPPGVYELGGPEVATFRELMERMLEDHPAPAAARRACRSWLARLQAGLLDSLQRTSGGLFTNTIAHPRPGAPARPRQRRLRRGARASPSSASARPRWRRCSRAISTPTARAASTTRSTASAGNLRLADLTLGAPVACWSPPSSGVLEGLTEFIPVSSTGHMLLAGHFLGFHSTGKAFEVLIQLGAILRHPVGLRRAAARARRRALPTRSGGPPLRRGVLLAFLPAVVARRAAARLHQDRALRDPGADRGDADPRRHRAALGRPAPRAARATTTRWTSRCRWR